MGLWTPRNPPIIPVIRVNYYEWDYDTNDWQRIRFKNYSPSQWERAIDIAHRWKKEGRSRRVTFMRVDL